MNNTEAVITGIGVVSPIGIGKEQFWGSLFEGKSAFKPITLFDTSDLKVRIAGEVIGFNPKTILGDKGLMDLDRATLLLLSAAKLALDDSSFVINENNTHRTGVSVGTTLGSLHSISKFDRESITEGPQYVNPSTFPSTVGNSAASRISIRFQIKGFNTTISTGMCASLDAIDYARDFLKLDKAETILVGSVEDLSIQTFLGLHQLKYLAGIEGEAISCPFDKRRNGIIFSEGATVMVMQSAETAKKNSSRIYGEILGAGSCFDPAKFYRYNPKGRGMIQAMRLALKDARLNPRDIDCIFANANSTKDADLIEAQAIKEVFGVKVPVTAVKSTLGESFSVAGGFASIAALGALNQGIIPATANLEEKDAACDLDYVANKSRKKDISRVMINTFGFNGANTSVILGRHN